MPAVPGVLAKYVEAFVDGVSADLQALAARTTAPTSSSRPATWRRRDRQRRPAVWRRAAGVARRHRAAARATGDHHLGPPARGRRCWRGSGRGSSVRARCSICSSRPMPATRVAAAARYYELAIRLAHAAASVDLVPSPDEIAAIDRYRSVLLAAFDGRRRAATRKSGRNDPVARPQPPQRAVRRADVTAAGCRAASRAPDRGAAGRARRASSASTR